MENIYVQYLIEVTLQEKKIAHLRRRSEMTLYEIDNQIMKIEHDAIDLETGEININLYKDLDALKMAKEQKIENIALLYKNLMSDAEQIKAESQKLGERAKQKQKKAEWFKQYLQASLNGEKYESDKVEIAYRRTKSIECTLADVSRLPEQFIRYSTPELNKTEVKKFIEQGGEVEGCSLVEKLSMSIK